MNLTDSPLATNEKNNQSPRKRRTTSKKIASSITSQREEDISQCLTDIYRDETGHVPDMKAITIKKTSSWKKTALTLLFGSATLAALAWLGFWYVPQKSTVPDSRVAVAITGPASLTLGATTTYTITYQNNDTTAIHDVLLSTSLPSSFAYVSSSLPADNPGHTEWQLGSLLPRETRTLSVTGIVYGSLGDDESWQAALTYRPDNFNSTLQKISTFAARVATSPFALTINGPTQATDAADVDYTFTLHNSGTWMPSGLVLIPELPAGFLTSTSSPLLTQTNWPLATTPSASTTASNSGSDYVFHILGHFADNPPASSTIGADLMYPAPNGPSYRLAHAELPLTINTNRLAVALAINGSLTDIGSKPGDPLTITVRVKNASTSTIKNASVKLDLDAPSANKQSLLQWANITDQYDGNIQGTQVSDTIRRGEITWDSKKIPALGALKPNQEVEIDVRIPIKDGSSFDLSSIQSPAITVSAAAFTGNATGSNLTTSNPIIITLNSDTTFEGRDSASTASGQETHAVTWVLNNTFHELKDVTIKATVYGNASWSRTTTPTSGDITYNSTDQSVTWTIPDLPQSVDTANTSFTLTLANKNPSQNTLLSKVQITATDAVTNQTIQLSGDPVLLQQ